MIQIVVRVIPGSDKAKAFEQAVAEVVCLPGGGGNYAVSAGESENPCAQAQDWSSSGHVLGHDRKQSVWALVAKVAAWAATEAEKAR